MMPHVISPRTGDGTDGLASAYQRTPLTGASGSAVMDTAGGLHVGVVQLPSWQTLPLPVPSLSAAPVDLQTHDEVGPFRTWDQYMEGVKQGYRDHLEGRVIAWDQVKKGLGLSEQDLSH